MALHEVSLRRNKVRTPGTPTRSTTSAALLITLRALPVRRLEDLPDARLQPAKGDYSWGLGCQAVPPLPGGGCKHPRSRSTLCCQVQSVRRLPLSRRSCPTSLKSWGSTSSLSVCMPPAPDTHTRQTTRLSLAASFPFLGCASDS